MIVTHKMLSEAGIENKSQAAQKDKLTNARHFFPMDEGTIATSITDSIGGFIWDTTNAPELNIGANANVLNTVSVGRDNNTIFGDVRTAGATYAPRAKEVVIVVMTRSQTDDRGIRSPSNDPSANLQYGFGGIQIGERSNNDNDTITGSPNTKDGRLVLNHHDALWSSRSGNTDIFNSDIRTNIFANGGTWVDEFYKPPPGTDVISCVVKRANVMEFYRGGEFISQSLPISEALHADSLAAYQDWIPDTGIFVPNVHTEWRHRPYYTGAACQEAGGKIWGGTLAGGGLGLAELASDSPRVDGKNFAFTSDNPAGGEHNCQTTDTNERVTGEFPQNFYGVLMYTFENGAPSKQEIIHGLNYFTTNWPSNVKEFYPGWMF